MTEIQDIFATVQCVTQVYVRETGLTDQPFVIGQTNHGTGNRSTASRKAKSESAMRSSTLIA